MTHIFTSEEGNLLIRLVLAHLLADFLLQTNSMVADKKWFSKTMALHIAILFGLTGVLSGGLWAWTAAISVLHWLTDGLKKSLQNKYSHRETWLFAGDQAMHLLVLLLAWGWHTDTFEAILTAVQLPFLDYKISLIVLGYVFMIWPLGYLIKFALPKIVSPSTDSSIGDEVARGGRIIGQFERTIILTFVLLGQYEAIGFLITGKSIIRFAQHNENLRSEYVLVGTMISFGLSIVTGEIINWLLRIAT
jgi:hypothetical protein